MSQFIRRIDGTVFLDETRLWAALSTPATPVSQRLRQYLRLAGVRFHDEEEGGYNFVLEPQVAVIGFGGFPVSFNDDTPAGHIVVNKTVVTPTELVEQFANTMGRAGFYSYMNSGNHTPEQMDEVTTKCGHFSKAHTVNVDLSIMGYSAAIEGNLMLQRRWFNHVGRLTNTRTIAQCDPPLLIADPHDLPLAKVIRASIADAVGKIKRPEKGWNSKAGYRALIADHDERVNAFWPQNRCMILMINAGLSNLRGTVSDLGDAGQEREYHHILALITDALRPMFPAFLKHSSEFEYVMPCHWPSWSVWNAEREKVKKQKEKQS